MRSKISNNFWYKNNRFIFFNYHYFFLKCDKTGESQGYEKD